jgi:hypothetical protein
MNILPVVLPFMSVLVAYLIGFTPFMMLGGILLLVLNRVVDDRVAIYRPVVLAGCVLFTIHLLLSLLPALVFQADLLRMLPKYQLWFACDVIVMIAAIVSSSRKFRSLSKMRLGGAVGAG